MPKAGLTTHQWNERLTKYAEGSFKFERGQKPPKGTKWANILDKIERCQRQISGSSRNVFGVPIKCTCNYHGKVIQLLLVKCFITGI